MTGNSDPLDRRVSLRAERDGRDSRYLDVYLDEAGNLHIDGQDLGPSTAPVSSDGEYEWFQFIQASHLPSLKALLGAGPEENILDTLERSWTGRRSYDLEQIIRESDIPRSRQVWSG
jgi:hypothetical protein